MAGAKKAKGGKPAAGKKQVKVAKLSEAAQASTAAAAADVMAEIEAERKQELLQKQQIGGSSGVAAEPDAGANIAASQRNKEADAQAMLRSMGEHVDTRHHGEDMEVDDEGVGDGTSGSAREAAAISAQLFAMRTATRLDALSV